MIKNAQSIRLSIFLCLNLLLTWKITPYIMQISEKNLAKFLNKSKRPPKIAVKSRYGGGEGSRTPVRKPIPIDISERRRSSAFPHTKADRHAFVLSSRYIMTELSALFGSRSPLIDALAGPRYYRVGRLLN